MKRHHQHRVPAQLPKFWRPKLAESTKLEAKLVHHDLLQTIAQGGATYAHLLDWIETGTTYSRMMWLLQQDGEPLTEEAAQAVNAQLELYEPVCARWARWGKVQLTQPEMEIALQAAQVFDQLLEIDRNGIAVEAAHWSMKEMLKFRQIRPG
ncbi:MAG: hypothetical protein LBV56_07165 [Delftia acidovorans]|jgi:hypothetical protein|nr:hypothetical protein [Delftia acidovorans]